MASLRLTARMEADADRVTVMAAMAMVTVAMGSMDIGPPSFWLNRESTSVSRITGLGNRAARTVEAARRVTGTEATVTMVADMVVRPMAAG